MRDVVALELRHYLVEGPLREPQRHEVQDHWNVLRPLLGVRKPRIARELALSDHRAEPLEEVLGRRREDDPSPVLRLKSTTWPARVLKPAALAHDALPAVERRRVLHDAEGRLVERRVDPLPVAGRVAMAERGHDAERREEPGHVVRIHRGRARGRPISVTVDVPRTPERRSDRRVARPLIQTARLSERGDARHDQTRVDRVQRLPPEAPALEDAGPKVLENDVAPGHQPANDG